MPRKTKSARTIAVESKFVLTEAGKYECLVEGCKAKVCCQEKAGAPGRLSHLKSHAEEWQALPAAEERPVKKQRKEEDKAKKDTPKKEGEAEAEEKKVPEITITQADIVDYFARNLEPFERANDPLFSGAGLNRGNIPQKMHARAEQLFQAFLDAAKDEHACITIDSGTNSTVRTLNVCLNTNAVSRVLVAKKKK